MVGRGVLEWWNLSYKSEVFHHPKRGGKREDRGDFAQSGGFGEKSVKG